MITENKIINIVCTVLNVDFSTLLRGGRVRPLPTQRYILFYFLIKHLKYSLKKTGDVLHKDHATALRGKRIVEDLIVSKFNYDKEIQSKISEIDRRISDIYENKALYFRNGWRFNKKCFITQ